uniref:Vesicle transport protein GOT1B n=1 Tax=Glossina pallidipes TaxID=7398 RepID=A0A1A9Z1V4_GLOPL
MNPAIFSYLEYLKFHRSKINISSMIEITDLQKIGIGLAGFGVSFLFLGVLFLFDKGLLAIGNILFLSGLGCVTGLERTFRFFFQRHKFKGTSAFFGGIFVVLMGYPLIGMIIESYGFFALFSGFFPVAIGFLSRVPILGSLISRPFMQRFKSVLPQIKKNIKRFLCYFVICGHMSESNEIICIEKFYKIKR